MLGGNGSLTRLVSEPFPRVIVGCHRTQQRVEVTGLGPEMSAVLSLVDDPTERGICEPEKSPRRLTLADSSRHDLTRSRRHTMQI
jgi:hypothetical protein